MRKAMIRGYEPPCTLWTRVELEGLIMVGSNDTLVIDDKTNVSIERQNGANESTVDGSGNIVAKQSDEYTIKW